MRRTMLLAFALVVACARPALDHMSAAQAGGRPSQSQPSSRGILSPFATIQVDRNPFALADDERRGHVFVVSSSRRNRGGQLVGSGHITMLDAPTGHLLRTVTEPLISYYGSAGDYTSFMSPPNLEETAVDAHTGRLFVILSVGTRVDKTTAHVAGPGIVGVFDTQSGAPVSTVTLGKTPRSVMVDERRGHVFVTDSAGGAVYMLDATTGALLHTTHVGYFFPVTLALDRRRGRVFVSGQRGLIMLDATTGALLRRLPLGTRDVCGKYGCNRGNCVQPFCSLAVDESAGRLIVDSALDSVTTLVTLRDSNTGAILRSSVVQATPYGAVADATARRFFLFHNPPYDNSNDMHAMVSILDSHNGRVVRTVQVGLVGGAAAATMAVDERAGRLFVAVTPTSQPGSASLVAVDVQSGRVLRTVPIGVNLLGSAIAFDQAAQRIFVPDNVAGTVRAFDTSH